MGSLRRLLARSWTLVSARYVDRQMDREITAHLALLQDDFERRGLSPGDARRAARLALGGVEQAKERHRDSRSVAWLEDLRRDVPYALRGLRRTPGFTVAALVTLALGVGATTAVVSVARTILVTPLPILIPIDWCR